MTSVLNLMADNKNQDFYALVSIDATKPGELYIKTIGSESKNGNTTCIYESAKEFVDDIPKLFTSAFKAVLFYVCDLQTSDFKHNIAFCKAAKAQMDLLHIPNYFINSPEFIASSMLIKSDITVNLQEIVLMVMVGNKAAVVTEYQYTKNGYEKVAFRMVDIDAKENRQAIREKVIGSANPRKILIMYKRDGKSTADFLRKHVLKSMNLVVSDTEMGSSAPKFVIEWSKWLLDKSYTKYYVLPSCGRMFTLFAPFEKLPLITVGITDKVPFEKTVCVSKINGVVLLKHASIATMNYVFDGALEVEQECHRVKVTLAIDAESFPTVDYDAFESPSVKKMPETLNKEISEKVPVIGFYDDCSVICIYNEEDKGYKFLDAWNGQCGKALALSFDAPKPLFGTKVYGNLKLKKTSVVYDLIKIMSMPEDEIKVDKRWPFIITKDENNPVLIEFDNEKGDRKAATPAFLMAILLKEHIKVIKSETGQTHTEFGFICFDEFTKDEKDRVEKQLREAFKLLKVDCVVGIFSSD